MTTGFGEVILSAYLCKMKNVHIFFMLCSFISCWMNFSMSPTVYGQERNASVTAVFQDTVSMPDTMAVLRDTTAIPDSMAVQTDTAALVLSDIDRQMLADSIKREDSIPSVMLIGLKDQLDTLPNRIFAYQVLERNSFARTQIEIDTALSRFEINNPVMRNYFAGSYLGNNGLSYYPIGFEARKRLSDCFFTDHVALYMHVPEETIYYQTQMPFTLAAYSSAGSKAENESVLSVVHTQNVNEKWNVGLDYDIIASAGQFPNQNSSDHAISLFSAYRGKQYSMYTNFNWNNIRMRENGGLADIDNFNADAPKTNVMRSMSGKTVMLNRSFYVTHSYAPKEMRLFSKTENTTDSVNVSRFTFQHTLKYEWTKREYTDTANYLRLNPTNFLTQQTHDSLYFRRLENHFELMIKEQARNRVTAGFSVGLLSEMDRYNTNILPWPVVVSHDDPLPETGWGGQIPPVSWTDSIVAYRESRRYFNTAVTGRFFNHTGKYMNWDFNGRFYFTGYKLGNMNINGTIRFHYYTDKGKNSLLLGGSIENAKPAYFLEEYASNLVEWKTNFDPSQEIRLRGEFLMPHRHLKVGLYLSHLNRYVYFNEQAKPEQASELLIVGTGFLEKDIHWWKLHFLFRLYGQYSSNAGIIPLPAFAGYQSTCFEGWLVKDVLNFQLGWDVNYHTLYYAYDYMPPTGMFFLQENRKTGGFPFVDAFMNFRIKKARFFVKTEGLYSLIKPLGKEYFMVYRYPMNLFRVKFGISWAFYD